MGDTLSLSSARGDSVFFYIRKREGAPDVYFSHSTAVYIFAHCMILLHVYMLQG